MGCGSSNSVETYNDKPIKGINQQNQIPKQQFDNKIVIFQKRI